MLVNFGVMVKISVSACLSLMFTNERFSRCLQISIVQSRMSSAMYHPTRVEFKFYFIEFISFDENYEKLGNY